MSVIIKKSSYTYYYILFFIHLAVMASALDPYINFPTYLELPSVGSTSIGIQQDPNKNIIFVNYGGNLSSVSPHGDITQSVVQENFFIKNVFWDTDNFVITTEYREGRVPISSYQIIRYGYNLTIEQIYDPAEHPRLLRSDNIDLYLSFTGITRHNDYYYLGGINKETYQTFIKRLSFNNLLPDSSFNNDNDGLFYFDSEIFSGRIFDILIHEIEGQTYIIVSGFGRVAILPNQNLDNFSVLNLSLPSPTYTSAPIGITSCDNSSIFVASSNTVYKYTIDRKTNTPRLLLDTSFNKTGSISFDYSEHVEFTGIKKMGDFLFVEGYYNGGGSGITVCYNIHNPEKPYLEKTFFDKGYLQAIGTMTTDTIPSFFAENNGIVSRYKLNASFAQTFTNKFTLSEKLNLLSSYNIPLPFIV